MEGNHEECSLTVNQFWCGISILLANYHAINRKIFACIIKKIVGIRGTNAQEVDDNAINDVSGNEYTSNHLQLHFTKCEQIITSEPQIYVVYFKLLSKKVPGFIEATGYVDFKNISYTLKFNTTDLDDFKVQLRQQQLKIIILKNGGRNTDKTQNWLEYVFKPKFLKWCLNYSTNENIPIDKNTMKSSLNLIDMEKYNELYKLLKYKYGKPMLQLWRDAQESTDPLKYIYEDLAIAAYLITLWESEMIKTVPIVFADLGCGNGLLVYILNEEGYLGYGYDLRKRKPWRLYPEHIANKLYEQTIEPENFKLNNNINWLIGNHSDELSPWLPVLAATCSYTTSYFLLPCCAYEFSGMKYQRRNSSLSVYNDFCNYVEYISNICGYVTLKDRLKIPSTKRIAFVGINRNYDLHEFPIKREKIKMFVNKEQNDQVHIPQDRLQLRTKQELVKNCTKIDRTLLNGLIKKIFTLLLNTNEDGNNTDDETSWLIGGQLTLKNLIQLLHKEDLGIIKSECGGLKTLLRNHHEIFILTPDDVIRIRKPEIKANQQQHILKKRRCFFYDNHPHGCPLSNETCRFIH